MMIMMMMMMMMMFITVDILSYRNESFSRLVCPWLVSSD